MRIHTIVATLCFCLYSIAAPTTIISRLESSTDLNRQQDTETLQDTLPREVVSLSGAFRRDAEPLADTFRRDAEPLADTFKRDAEPLADTFKRRHSLDKSDLHQNIPLPDTSEGSSRSA